MSRYNNVGFPDDYINPQEKNEKYWLQVAQAIWGRYETGRALVSKNTRDYVRKMRAYSSGRQSIEPYLDQIVGPKKPDANGKYVRKGMVNVNYDIVSIAPKLKELMLGQLEEIDHNVVVEAIDEVSVSKRLKKKYQTLVKGMLMPVLRKMEKENGIPAPKMEIDIRTPEDLEMYEMIGGFKLGMEIAMEKLAEGTDKDSKWQHIARLLRSDYWDTNMGCVRSVFNPLTNTVKKEYVDVELAVIGRSDSLMPEDIPYAGHIKRVTLGEIFSRLKGKPGESEVDRMKKVINVARSNGSNSIFTDVTESDLMKRNPIDQRPRFYDMVVDVLCFEYITVDREFKTYRESNGVMKYHTDTWGETKTGERRETNVVDKRMLYECEWLIGSEYMIEYGLSPYMARPEKRSVRVSYSYVELQGASKVERIIGFLDSLQLTHMKLQAAKAAAAPKGLAIDIQALNNVNLGDGINKPLELIRVYRQTGTYAYRSFSLHNKIVNPNGTSITELAGGIGPQLEEWMTCYANDIKMIFEITGFTDVSAASPDQSPEMTVGASQIAMQQTTNSMKMLYEAVSSVKQDSATVAVTKAVAAIKHSEASRKAYKEIIGENSVEVIRSIDGAPLESLGLHMIAKPTQHQKNSILAAGQKALEIGKNGKPALKYSDYFMIERMLDAGKVKEAQAFLAYRTQQNEEENFKENQEMIMTQKEGEKEVKLFASQLKIQEIEAETQSTIQEEEARKIREIEVENVKSANRIRELETEAELQARYNVEVRKRL